MAQRRPLMVAEREAIYRGKLADKRLRDLAKELSCSWDCARKWWRVGRDRGLEGLRRSGRNRSETGALSRFYPLVAQQALYWKRQHPKRGATRILADMEKDPVLKGLVLPQPGALANFFREACPELLQRRQRHPPAPPTAQLVHQLWQVDGKEAVHLADETIATVFEMGLAKMTWRHNESQHQLPLRGKNRFRMGQKPSMRHVLASESLAGNKLNLVSNLF